MAMNLKTSLKLSQQLRMTPQLQQAIKLLQLSRVELENEVRKELVENPVLEELQDTAENDPARQSDSMVAEEIRDQGPADQKDNDPTKQDEFEWENYVDTSYKPPQGNLGGNEEIMNYENIISNSTSLSDHLMWQVGLSGFNDEEENLISILFLDILTFSEK